MNNSEKIIKMLSGLIEGGILTSKDLKNEVLMGNFREELV